MVSSEETYSDDSEGGEFTASEQGPERVTARHRRVKLLYLYSGSHRPLDGFAKFCKELNADCDCIDIKLDKSHDLLSQDFWEELFHRLDEYEAFLLAPPCGTFTHARQRGDGGPRPLRGLVGSARYGLKWLSPEEKKQVREETILSFRACDVARHATTRGKPWILAQPQWVNGDASMFMLDEFAELLRVPGVRIRTLSQCKFGCPFTRDTDLLSNIDDLTPLTKRCSHPEKAWRIPWSGERFWCSHPPQKGGQLAVPEAEWTPSMLSG